VSSCHPAKPLVNSSKQAQDTTDTPYVILISLDGFRWDYVNTYKPPALTDFIKNGTQAESLIPVFPSKTFPNHYSIATGMYPEKHGIIGNTFYNSSKDDIYKIGNREQVTDGSFYKGSPIWCHAENAGITTASYFFVGSEAEINGVRPTYYYDYDGRVKNSTRVNQAINWLKLPEEKRPHLIMMYFSDMDDIGHKYGPNNKAEIKNALFNLDSQLGDLFQGVKDTGLDVNILIVSDHGMTELQSSNFIPLETIKNEDEFLTIDNGSMLSIHPKENVDSSKIFETLKAKENHFKVYKTADTPGFEYTPKHKDWGSIQVVADSSYYFTSNKAIAHKKDIGQLHSGVHGFNPDYKDMHGIFYANGSAFKKGTTIEATKNINIYPLICELLGLEIPDNIDGDLGAIKDVIKN
ncbi:phosphodiesterase I, partial [Formosa agariphila KMM 3901]